MKKPKYTRQIVFKNRDVEVVTIDWQPGSATPIHDHGKSYGIIRVLEGHISEKVFAKNPVRQKKHKVHTKGAIFYEKPRVLHSVGNESPYRARTLHIYTPALKMKSYKIKIPR